MELKFKFKRLKCQTAFKIDDGNPQRQWFYFAGDECQNYAEIVFQIFMTEECWMKDGKEYGVEETK